MERKRLLHSCIGMTWSIECSLPPILGNTEIQVDKNCVSTAAYSGVSGGGATPEGSDGRGSICNWNLRVSLLLTVGKEAHEIKIA
jgi:hypothetical protein